MAAGFWNVNGWSVNQSSDNFIFRSEAVNYLNFDILGLAETHLKGHETIKLDGYLWFGHNRVELHRNAWSGSGGVGFLVKQDLLDSFDIKIEDKSSEGILWLSLKNFEDNSSFYACVCYLPPKHSTRSTDPCKFYDTLLSNIYEFQEKGMIFICGDVNSRCGEEVDFIEGIDDLPLRDVVDFKRNEYCDILIQFLIDANFCILNGRNCLKNDFTCIRPQGCSVVDYCFISHDCLNIFN